jgi:hypothetical protein
MLPIKRVLLQVRLQNCKRSCSFLDDFEVATPYGFLDLNNTHPRELRCNVLERSQATVGHNDAYQIP